MPVLLRHLQGLRGQVAGGFPFKIGERLGALEEIETRLQSGVVSPERSFNRIWAFVEDELRISRENAIYTQSINLQGENVLVDIAKLGNAMMFFRTRDLRYGRATQTPGGWRFEIVDHPEHSEQVAVLFDSLRKQIRQGYFRLPNALPSGTWSSS